MLSAAGLTGSCFLPRAVAAVFLVACVAGCSGDVSRVDTTASTRPRSGASQGGPSQTSFASVSVGAGPLSIPRPPSDIGGGAPPAEIAGPTRSPVGVAAKGHSAPLARQDRVPPPVAAKKKNNAALKVANLKRRAATAKPQPSRSRSGPKMAAVSPAAAPVAQTPPASPAAAPVAKTTSAPPAAAPVAKTTPAPPAAAPVAQTPPAPPAAAPVAKTTSAPLAADPTPTFHWPVHGKIVARYGSQSDGEKNDGIAIAVPEGTPIKSAGDGEVIYAGSGLKGFGNLVLVRHADSYVTAYGHAKELTVARGDTVKRGDIIGRSGQTGEASTPRVHFEIRKDSVPVDPMRLLKPGSASL